MKSVSECRQLLQKQWWQAGKRVERLLENAWPISIAIGKPSPAAVKQTPETVRLHLMDWQSVKEGEVTWEEVTFRATGQALRVPVRWIISSADAWVKAAAAKEVAESFQFLQSLLPEAEPALREYVVKKAAAFESVEVEEAKRMIRVAMALKPGQAEGLPLRAMPVVGVGADTKFFERNRALLSGLLDVRFGGVVSGMGLESFLDAERSGEQWLLVVDLDGGLMPVKKMRVRSVDFTERFSNAKRVLVVENERCVHFLPRMAETLAILGAGLNLEWMSASWLRECELGYWGDLDTWGLLMLSRAREYAPGVTPLLMSLPILEAHQDRVVKEPTPAGSEVPAFLLGAERELYRHLLVEGARLEQEFIDPKLVDEALRRFLLNDY